MFKCMSYITCMVLTMPLVFTQMTLEDIKEFRSELIEEFDISPDLLPKTVRLIFQDCAGSSEDDNDSIISICNGCINYDNPDNTGLKDEVISKLDEIFYIGEWNKKMSRADLWATAATIAIEYAEKLNTLPIIPYYFGRRDCSETGETTKFKLFPSAKNGWIDTQIWFNDNFFFTTQETVAILGAHTLGQSHLRYSGYSNLPWEINGIDNRQHILNNQYYKNLINENLNWTQSQSAEGLWEYKDQNNEILMLNSDISLVIHIDNKFDAIFDGKVNCKFSECSVNIQTINVVEIYANSNQKWLNDFAQVFEKLIITGYNSDELTKIVPITTTTTIASKSTDNLTTKTEMNSISTVKGDIYTSEYDKVDVSDGILDKLNDYCGEHCGVGALCVVIGVVIISICILCYKRNKNEGSTQLLYLEN